MEQKFQAIEVAVSCFVLHAHNSCSVPSINPTDLPSLTTTHAVIFIILILLRIAYIQTKRLITVHPARGSTKSRRTNKRHMSFVVKWGRER